MSFDYRDLLAQQPRPLDGLDDIGLGLALKLEFEWLRKKHPDADAGQYAAAVVRVLQILSSKPPCPNGCMIEDDSPADRFPDEPHMCTTCGRWWAWSSEAFRWVRYFPE